MERMDASETARPVGLTVLSQSSRFQTAALGPASDLASAAASLAASPQASDRCRRSLIHQFWWWCMQAAALTFTWVGRT